MIKQKSKSFIDVKPSLLFLFTFLVAFCSIIYELVFAQFLSLFFGNTVLMYSATIGLYLFFLGIGSFAYSFVKKKAVISFFFVELLLTFFSIISLFYLIFIQGFTYSSSSFLSLIALFLSFLPVLIVGFLSGLEIPLLTENIDRFSKNSSKKSFFSEVLGVDYFGSLVGSLLYGLALYPKIGLFNTLILASSINFLVAVIFFFIFLKKKKAFLFFLSLILIFFIFFLLYRPQIISSLEKTYFERSLTYKFSKEHYDFTNITLIDAFSTSYQQYVQFAFHFNNSEVNKADTCFVLGKHLQFCESWQEPYHQGLVDIPLKLYYSFVLEPKKKIFDFSNVSVLLLGGGDFIAVNHLKKYGVIVDQVEIDKTLATFFSTSPYYLEFNDNAFLYEHLQIYYEDAFSYVLHTNKTYDLVILDLPGIEDSSLLPLYSKEFYSSLFRLLSKNGFLVTWYYNDGLNSPFKNTYEHTQIYESVLFESGFSKRLNYQVKIPGTSFLVDDFLILSKDDFNSSFLLLDKLLLSSSSPFFNSSSLKDTFSSSSIFLFQGISNSKPPFFLNSIQKNNSVKVNSVFYPNKGLILKS